MIHQKINKELANIMLKEMPQDKKELLDKCLNRNFILTSARVLSHATIRVYKEGWYLKLDGTRVNFRVYAKDNDGEFIFTRKPNEKDLHFLYEQRWNMNESDFDFLYI